MCPVDTFFSFWLVDFGFWGFFSFHPFLVDFLYIKEVELTDEERAIKANLMGNTELPPEVLDKIVPDWWKKEPFR